MTKQAKSNRGAKTGIKSKSDLIIAMFRRKSGATLDDLQKVTQWQTHSVRGFLSGTVRKKLALPLTVGAPEGRARRYRIANA